MKQTILRKQIQVNHIIKYLDETYINEDRSTSNDTRKEEI